MEEVLAAVIQFYFPIIKLIYFEEAQKYDEI